MLLFFIVVRKFLSFVYLIIALYYVPCSLAEVKVIEVELIIKEHKFIPEVLEIPAGHKVVITVDNQDSTIEEFESIDLKREKLIPGKTKAKIILAPLSPGEYKFFGEFHEETAQGKIIVKKEME